MPSAKRAGAATVRFDADAAALLAAAARANRKSLGEYVRTVMVPQARRDLFAAGERLPGQRRRNELIDKKYAEGLTAAEAEELESLQVAAMAALDELLPLPAVGAESVGP